MASNINQLEVINSQFSGLADDSRVWIWQSDRQLSEEEANAADSNLKAFTNQWVSHNRALVAKSAIILSRFWVVVLDESAGSGASGCSIDSLSHAVQNISGALGVNVLDRTQFCFFKNDKIVSVSMNELSKSINDNVIDENQLVFDNLIKTKAQLTEEWLKPLAKSWHQRFV